MGSSWWVVGGGWWVVGGGWWVVGGGWWVVMCCRGSLHLRDTPA
ncbi:hypothetical protein [Mycolicibacterium bacteremicum]|nr:hypothetical protein [Mycolicibacterium bacteremicum]